MPNRRHFLASITAISTGIYNFNLFNLPVAQILDNQIINGDEVFGEWKLYISRNSVFHRRYGWAWVNKNNPLKGKGQVLYGKLYLGQIKCLGKQDKNGEIIPFSEEERAIGFEKELTWVSNKHIV
ncbi:MAG: hypothetical protein DWQ19_11320 [Crenarchaeota archaeon]|nr:MAG: hypothetical protein DWQ19_11320 [Thermoproteota archaeon]